MRKLLVGLVGLILMIPYASAQSPTPDNSMQITSIHKQITTHSGWLNTSRPIVAEDLKGRIILLDFWTYCCINCMHVIPDLKFLEQKYGHDLTVIGVHSAKFKNEQDSENIRQAILRYDLEHPVVNDFDFSTWNSFGIRSWPTFVLINPLGTIEGVYSGEGNRDKVVQAIDALRVKYAGRINTAPLPLALEKDKVPPTVLSFPSKLATTDNFNGKQVLFVADSRHQQIQVMTLDGAIIDSIGSGATGHDDNSFEKASFDTPQGIIFQNNILYIADTNNHLLRAADFKTRMVTTLAGTGVQGYVRQAQNAPALQTPLASPWDLTFYPDAAHIAIAMAGTHQIWNYDINARTVSVIAGNGQESIVDGSYPNNALAQTSGLSAIGTQLYFVDAETSSLRVLENGTVKTLIGTGLFDFGFKDGKQGTALMQHPLGVFADQGNVYVADSYNHSIRRYQPVNQSLTTFAGHGERGNADGAGAAASFNEPNALLRIEDKFYVADTNNNAIRVIDLNGNVTTLKVTLPAKQAAAELSDNLPNLQKLPLSDVGLDGASIILELQDGWHINPDAPSNIALFDITNAPVALANFMVDTIQHKQVTLPKLQAGKNYRLQATLYFCEDKAGAQCLIKSFDQSLTAQAGGQNTLLFKLN